MDEAQKQAMAEAVARIRENMTTAAKAAGRDPGEVLLCAACKTRTVEDVRYSADLPIDLVGENHVQDLVEKTDPAIIGGMIVVCGDNMLDGSVRTKLENMQKQIRDMAAD